MVQVSLDLRPSSSHWFWMSPVHELIWSASPSNESTPLHATLKSDFVTWVEDSRTREQVARPPRSNAQSSGSGSVSVNTLAITGPAASTRMLWVAGIGGVGQSLKPGSATSWYEPTLGTKLVGVRLSNLVHGNHQISLFDDTEETINLYEAIDFIKHKHGAEKLTRATTLGVNRRVRMEVNMFKGTIR